MRDLISEIRSRLRYEPDTGKCFWILENRFGPKILGKEAGSLCKDKAGRRRVLIKINCHAQPRARVAFIFMTGRIPNIVDHINGVTDDDRWCNLREANKSQNRCNIASNKKASPWPIGVRRSRSGRYEARIGLNRKKIYIGTFDTPREAYQAYLHAKRRLHGEFFGRLPMEAE